MQQQCSETEPFSLHLAQANVHFRLLLRQKPLLNLRLYAPQQERPQDLQQRKPPEAGTHLTQASSRYSRRKSAADKF